MHKRKGIKVNQQALTNRHVKGEESCGYGLGLSIVDRVTQRLGWRLEMQSAKGAGTRVSIVYSNPETSPLLH